ncbi:clock-controlled pheromone ccg-4 precursor [Metarhizium album ARSEF 1941]|uniref:Clock-controlled pheromone ccg-4 n=1 Tax=Metarhizium album (strain ARSEF 1941) TaxID=1081103 RepID=A0A0B2WWG8_METAS|nr:clock-controlled pheromone ccg-4 precursor [Metarhizium album ARSEF 1941]KHN97959.1 clock-controlled pheromone ccg-4 precursor [Metarhizium album ARSEF 1941]
MRITSAVLALAAAGAHAAPAPAPAPAAEAVPWCWRPGEPCWKVKRVAEAFSESLKSSGALKERAPEAEYSNSPGGAAYTAKRSLNELAHVAALTAREPAEFYRDLELEARFGADEGLDKREATPDPWCWRPGMPCWKRDSSNEPVPMKDKRWCNRPGEPCWKAKRAAEAVMSEIGQVSKRDDGGDGNGGDHPDHGGHFPGYCNGPNVLCWKKREASPDPDAEAEPQWCWRPGEPCWKAKRDLHALQLAARNVVEALE